MSFLSWSAGYDKSLDGKMDEAKRKVLGDKPFTVGLTENHALVAGESMKLGSRTAPTSTAASVSGATPGTQGANYQQGLAANLEAIARGGPTAGQQQLTQGLADAKRANYAAAFSRPGASARSLRTVGNQNSLTDAVGVRQLGQLQAQEQQAAMAQLGQAGSAMRAGDMATAAEWNKIGMANAGFQSQSDIANQQASMQWQNLTDAQRRALLGMGVDLSQNEFGNKLNYYGAEYEAAAARRANEAAMDQRNGARAAQGLQFATSVFGMFGGMGGKK
jgi:hypothetical protein